MKKFCLSLGVALILVCWSGAGYYDLGTRTALGQPPYPPPPPAYPQPPAYPPNYYAPPYYQAPYNYYNYYSAPTADPLSQFLYYVGTALFIGGQMLEEQEEHQRSRR
jgi:hypothetical protein